MNLSPSAHKWIFLLACLCLGVALIVAAVAVERDNAMHIAYYEEYEVANALFGNRLFEESYDIFLMLADVYPDSYTLELKMAVCAMNMDMWPEAVAHSLRTLELYPLLARDSDLMEAISHSLREIGEDATADWFDDYAAGISAR